MTMSSRLLESTSHVATGQNEQH